MSLYDLILAELEERKCAHVYKYPPYFVCSLGVHLFNLRNQENPVLFEAGRVMDTRLHIMFVSPPGFSKTFWLEQFLRGVQAILTDTVVDTGFEGAMTEAGFVGTFRSTNGQIVFVPGLAETKKNAIVGIEEFAVLTALMQQAQYGSLLDTALLSALDSGYCYKRLATGKISYKTNLTLWTGTQPARFDLSSGLGRRFLFLQFIPKKADFWLLKRARREAKGMRYNPVRLQKIREMIKKKVEEISKIESVKFNPRLYQLFDNYNVVHYEEPLYEKMFLGYCLMKRNPSSHFTITFDEVSLRLFKQEVYWRNQIRRGSEYAEVMLIISDAGGKIKLKDLREQLLMMGLDWSRSSELVQEMLRLKLLKSDGVFIYVKK